MSFETGPTEAESFHEFIGKRLADGGKQLSADQLLAEFRAWQDELQRLQARLSLSHEQYLRGEAKELDTEALKQRVRARLAQEGIVD